MGQAAGSVRVRPIQVGAHTRGVREFPRGSVPIAGGQRLVMNVT